MFGLTGESIAQIGDLANSFFCRIAGKIYHFASNFLRFIPDRTKAFITNVVGGIQYFFDGFGVQAGINQIAAASQRA